MVRAIQWYFHSHTEFVQVDGVSISQESTNLQKGKGKPYDLAVFLKGTFALLFELKDCQDDGSFSQWNSPHNQEQNSSLIQLWKLGVFIRYAFNGWNWTLVPAPEPPHVVQSTLVLEPRDFATYVEKSLPEPESLKSLLDRLTNSNFTNHRLTVLLERDPSAFQSLSNHALIVLANIEEERFMLLDTAAPLKLVHKYYEAEEEERAEILAQLQDDEFGHWLAMHMFELKDGRLQALLDAADAPAAEDDDTSPGMPM
ncbi:hypothetical protein DXT88_15465 [Herbaspirillum lusitanum]|nr:hypothetical protein [Herbaspirillum lusitanum]